MRWKAGAAFAAAGILPAAAAGLAAAPVPQTILTVAFATIAALSAIKMLRPADTARPKDGGVRPGKAAGAGAALGTLIGLLGVGGSFLAVPALVVTVLAFEMDAAVGTSLLVITANSLASLATRSGTAASLNWALIDPFMATAISGTWYGSAWPRRSLRPTCSASSPWSCWQWPLSFSPTP